MSAAKIADVPPKPTPDADEMRRAIEVLHDAAAVIEPGITEVRLDERRDGERGEVLKIGRIVDTKAGAGAIDRKRASTDAGGSGKTCIATLLDAIVVGAGRVEAEA